MLAWQPKPERIGAFLKRDMARFYPALARERVGMAWGGVMPMTRHRCPVIGQLAPNIWFATGFAGLGVTLSSAFGRLISAGLVEDDQIRRLFEALGLPSGGEQRGRILNQFVYWWHQMRAGFAAPVP